MNILIGLLLIGVCVYADFDSKTSEGQSPDMETIYNLFHDNQKPKIEDFVQSFRKTPSNRRWNPKSKLCYDSQFPWVMIPCELIRIKAESTKPKNESVHEQSPNSTVPLPQEGNGTEVVARMYNPFQKSTKAREIIYDPESYWSQQQTIGLNPEYSKTYPGDPWSGSYYPDVRNTFWAKSRPAPQTEPNKPFEMLLRLFPKACQRDDEITNCRFRDTELDVLNGITKITKKIYVIKK